MESVSLKDLGINIKTHDEWDWCEFSKIVNADKGIRFDSVKQLRAGWIFTKSGIQIMKTIDSKHYITPLFAVIILQSRLDKNITFDGIDLDKQFRYMFKGMDKLIRFIYEAIDSKKVVNQSIALFSASQYYCMALKNEFLINENLCNDFANMFVRKVAMLSKSRSRASLSVCQAINICAVLADRNKKTIDWGDVWQQK